MHPLLPEPLRGIWVAILSAIGVKIGLKIRRETDFEIVPRIG
jgi:uncharacterized membrane protein